MDGLPNEDDNSDPEQAQIEKAIERLTSTEKEIINEVLQRDDDIRAQEKQRLRCVFLFLILGRFFRISPNV